MEDTQSKLVEVGNISQVVVNTVIGAGIVVVVVDSSKKERFLSSYPEVVTGRMFNTTLSMGCGCCVGILSPVPLYHYVLAAGCSTRLTVEDTEAH